MKAIGVITVGVAYALLVGAINYHVLDGGAAFPSAVAGAAVALLYLKNKP